MSEAGDAASAIDTPVVRLHDVGLAYGRVRALEGITLDVPAGRIVGVIGPDGVGKSSLFALIAGARAIQRGTIAVLGGDMASARHRRAVCPRIAYMPQGLGKNLYPTLSVTENVDFFGRLFGHARAERDARSRALLDATGLAPFADRPAGKLSGGMKQKLGLCCALIHDPDLLILDEPTTGVDPLSRRQFWELVERIRAQRPGMSVIVATAYMEEAARFDWLVAMNEGRVLATGTPAELLARTGTDTTEAAFIALLPETARAGHRPVVIAPHEAGGEGEIAIEAHDLTMRFGSFTAVDHVSFRIRRGEIFGFLGSNGCGKTTTMKMLTGLLPASEGHAQLFGKPVRASDLDTRRRVGYMSQSFSLYGELTVRQNLELHARLFGMAEAAIPARVAEMAARFDLAGIMDAVPHALPLGGRQRLSLAVAMIHAPEMLILDEPTSGVDPLARDAFWRILLELARSDNVTIFISTHFMNEAERCDRISLMHAGRVLVSDTPAAIVAARGAANLEDAFISHLEEALAERATGGEGSVGGSPRRSGAPAAIVGPHRDLRSHTTTQPIGPRAAERQRNTKKPIGPRAAERGCRRASGLQPRPTPLRVRLQLAPRCRALAAVFGRRRRHGQADANADTPPRRSGAPAATNEPLQSAVSPQPRATASSLRRLYSYTLRESLELRRDPVRLALAALGTILLMLVLGYGINMDVEDLPFAVLDRDGTRVSRDYALNLAGSRYFIERPPFVDDADLDRRMRAGEISLALEIPPGFAADLARGRPVEIGAWIDGAIPARAETVRGYVQGMHQHWLAARARETSTGTPPTAPRVETRFRYNPEVKSLPAMAPAVMPLLLFLIPAVLTAMAVVREKELGSIVNLYVTPVTRLEFLLGKQIPYVVLAMFNFLLLTALTVYLFDVPLKGSFAALAAAALLYVMAATAFGLLVSAFVSSQVAALFAAGVLGILPAVQFSGMIEPVSSLAGGAALIGSVHPATHFLTIVRGTFSKGLGFADLQAAFVPLAFAAPVLVAAGALLLKKQAR